MAATPQELTPKTKLNLWDTTSLIVGVVIGVGIFFTPASVFRIVNGPWQAIAIWLIGGFISLIGVFCFAELGSTYPRSGGEYVYLTRSFGSLIGFLFAWVQLIVIRTAGTTSGIAYAFGSFGSDFFGIEKESITFLGIQTDTVILFSCALGAGSVFVFTVVNVVGVLFGKWTQNFLTFLKVLGIGGLLVSGLWLVHWLGVEQKKIAFTGEVIAASDAKVIIQRDQHRDTMVSLDPKTTVIVDDKEQKLTGDPDQLRRVLVGKTVRVVTTAQHPEIAESIRTKIALPIMALIGLGLIPVLWTYMGWHEAAYVVSEVRDGQRTIPLALLFGIAIILVIYLAVNVAFLAGLGFERAGESRTISAELLGDVLGSFGKEAGDFGVRAMALLIMISCLGAVHGTIFTSSRIFNEIGRDHPLFASLGKWNPRFGTPVNSIVLQGALSIGMMVFMSLLFKHLVTEKWVPADEDPFDTLLYCTSAPFWLFFCLTGLSLFVLRFKDPDLPRPFRVPLYPVVPALFCLICAWLVYNSVDQKPWHSLVGLGLLALGLPFYLLSERMRRSQTPGTDGTPTT